jgi:hypothetical protein
MNPIRGFAKGPSVKIETEDPKYTYQADLYGAIHRNRINNNSAKVTITLLRSSSSNELLSNYVELDRQSDSGVFPILISDANSTDLFESDSASIMQAPTRGCEKDAMTKKWVIMATNNTNYPRS